MKKKTIKIIYEDKYILVVNKESNLLTISTDNVKDKTLYHKVFEYIKSKNKNNKIFIVHRLDKDTSGLVVFAKSEEVKKILQDNWSKVIRKYFAVVHGVTKDSDTIKSYLRETKTLYCYSSTSGDLAITKYDKIKSSKKFSLLDINILTGKKNQIRVHMKDNNTPIVGDKKYGIADKSKKMLLLAYYLEFAHPFTKEIVKFELNLPTEYKEYFK